MTGLMAVDKQVLLWINGHHNIVLDAILAPIAYMGEIAIVWMLVIVILLIIGRPGFRRTAVLLLLTIIITDRVFASEIGTLFDRPRPYMILDGIRQLGIKWQSGSFPSGHAHSVFIAAIILSSRWKKLSPWLYTFAILTCYSRPYFGMHYPIDTLAGAFLGIFTGSAAVALDSLISKLYRQGIRMSISTQELAKSTEYCYHQSIYDVVLPAGGRISDSYAQTAGTNIKTLININGKSILSRTVDRLSETGICGKMVVVGSDELENDPACLAQCTLIPDEGDGPANIFAGIEQLKKMGSSGRILIVNTDLPFISISSILEFIANCPSDVDICVPVIRKEEFDPAYPNTRTKYVPLKDGEWTMGCVFMVNPEVLQANRDKFERVFKARKSQIQMASILGLKFILGLLFHCITVSHIEKRCSEILGCTAGAIMGSGPDLAFDLDTEQEFKSALQIIADKQVRA